MPTWRIKETYVLAHGQCLWESRDNFSWFGDPLTNTPKGKVYSTDMDQERHPAWICLAVDVYNFGGLWPTDTFVPFALFSLQGGVAHLSGVRTAHRVLSLQKKKKKSEVLLNSYPVHYMFPKTEVCGVAEKCCLLEGVPADSGLMAATPCLRW